MTTTALVGPGAIGTTFAAAVQDATGVAPVLCARRPVPAPALERPGGADVVLGGPVLTDPAALDGPADWVLCAVKAHQVAGAREWLRALCGPRTVVVALLNGVEHEALLRPWCGSATVLPAVVWAPVVPAGDARFALRGPARLQVPAGSAGSRLAELLAGGFAQVEVREDFAAAAWEKLLVNAAAGLLAVADEPARLFAAPGMRDAVLAVAREGAAVGRATGVALDDGVAERVAGWCAALPPEATTSIQLDRRAGRELEWDARNGVIGRLGREHGVPTPANDVLTALLRRLSR